LLKHVALSRSGFRLLVSEHDRLLVCLQLLDDAKYSGGAAFGLFGSVAFLRIDALDMNTLVAIDRDLFDDGGIPGVLRGRRNSTRFAICPTTWRIYQEVGI
jgi:hypothetical protein